MSARIRLHLGPLLAAAAMAVSSTLPVETQAYPYLPPSPGNLIITLTDFESQCLTPAAQFVALFDSTLMDGCAALAEQMIQDEEEQLDALGLLEDLESIKHYTRDASAELFPTPGVQNRTHSRSPEQWLQMSWDSWDDSMSCDEYVYKRFFEVSEFMRLADEYAGDPMAYMEIAFDAGVGSSLSNGDGFRDNDGVSWLQDQPPLVGGIKASFNGETAPSGLRPIMCSEHSMRRGPLISGAEQQSQFG